MFYKISEVDRPILFFFAINSPELAKTQRFSHSGNRMLRRFPEYCREDNA
ncbi:hypothetical protein yinte0001_11220 [Yersinia intermedia ATCC 29909]|nr:hypothetical protein yinte0001_11220 [Yersinia intermedia ATCC 29909]